jgi:hypothetical protein
VNLIKALLSSVDSIAKALALPSEYILLAIVISGAAAGAAKVAWSFVTYVLQVIRFHFSFRTAKYSVDFGPFEDVPDSIDGVYCHIIRYGTDQYLEKMASDQERYEGRLRNKVYKLKTRRDQKNRCIVQLYLRVHKRLGTQFKVFVRLKELSNADEVVEFLTSTKLVSGIHVSRYHQPTKITFIIEIFSTVQTVEGITNNFLYPV